MHVVIMGCGRVGSSLAAAVERLDHTVAVIDKDAQAFRRLGSDFHGQQVVGGGFDRRVLIEAGIERAGAFAAVSSGDNSNIISARVARETFGVEHVVARIYDAKRAEVYERLGIPTVATVPWTTDRLMRTLLPDGVASAWRDPTRPQPMITTWTTWSSSVSSGVVRRTYRSLLHPGDGTAYPCLLYTSPSPRD